MPIYEALCDGCDSIVTYHRTVADRNETPVCPRCGGETHKAIFTAPKSYITGKFEAFKSVVDGSIIDSQRAMREHNKRNDVVCLADGYDEETILAGNLGKPLPKSVAEIRKDIADDIQQSIHEVQNGYKPIIGESDE